MSFEAGRAVKAAQLHSMADSTKELKEELASATAGIDRAMSSIGSEKKETFDDIRRAASQVRGGDRWKTRGHEGSWHRWRVTPRKTLFTPYRVAKGPGKDIELNPSRLTVGITKSGRHFETVDNWQSDENSHRDIGESWVGYTVFTQKGHKGNDYMTKRSDILSHLKNGVRWACPLLLRRRNHRHHVHIDCLLFWSWNLLLFFTIGLICRLCWNLLIFT